MKRQHGLAIFDLDNTLLSLPVTPIISGGAFLVERGIVDGNEFAWKNERFYHKGTRHTGGYPLSTPSTGSTLSTLSTMVTPAPAADANPALAPKLKLLGTGHPRPFAQPTLSQANRLFQQRLSFGSPGFPRRHGEWYLNLASSLRHGVTTHSGRSWRGNLFTRCRCGT